MFQSITQNKWKTVFIVFLVTLFLIAVVYFVAYYFAGLGMIAIPIAVIFAFVTSWISYYYSDRIILSICSARPADQKQDRQVRDAMEGICIAAGLPMPRVYIMEDKSANAFATGRDPWNAVVCVTTGLLEQLDYYELEAVLAHELAHIGNRDILLSTVVSVMVGITVILSDIVRRTLLFGGRGRGGRGGGHPAVMIIGLIFVILAPIAGMIMKMALSRNREYLADATAVQFTRNPAGMEGALRKLSGQTQPLEKASQATCNMFIVNPFDNQGFEAGQMFKGLFSTHPPISKRIKAIQNLQ